MKNHYLKMEFLNISTNDKVKLDSYSISKNGNPVENQTNPTSNSINKNINLGIGESLELTYKIKLDDSAEDNTEYDIHKLMTYKPDTNQNAVNLDPNKLITLREKLAPPVPNTYKVNLVQPQTGGTISATPTSAKAGETITLSPTPAQGYKFVKYVVTANGQPVTVTGNKFTMPASDVTVTATFEKDSTPSEGEKILRSTSHTLVQKMEKLSIQILTIFQVNLYLRKLLTDNQDLLKKRKL